MPEGFQNYTYFMLGTFATIAKVEMISVVRYALLAVFTETLICLHVLLKKKKK